MADLICADCGTTNTGRAEFCSSCGAFLAWDGVPDAPPPSRPPAGPPSAAPSYPAASYRAASSPAASATPAPTGPPASAAPAWGRPPGGPPAQGGYPDSPSEFSYTIKAPPGRTVSLPPADPAGAFGAPGPGAWGGAPVAVAPPGSCPQCQTVNPPERRFCTKCGYQLFTPDPRRPAVAPVKAIRRPWWQRWIPNSWLPDRELVSGTARRAFRRSLPMTFRLRRAAGVVGVIAVIVGIFYLAGTNPVRWVKDRVEDMKGSLADVAGVQVASEPADAQIPGYPVDYVIDNAETAWATPWKQAVPPGICTPPGVAAAAGSPGSLLLVLPGPTAVRGIEIAAGLPASDQRRPHQYRPKTLELTFADGTCKQVPVGDNPALQRIPFDPVTTDQVRVAIIDAYPPLPDSPMNVVAVSEIRVLARP